MKQPLSLRNSTRKRVRRVLNDATIIGRLTADPEVRYTNSGKAVASFTLAVERDRSNNGEKQTDFIPVVVWDKQGENAAKYLSKGRLCAVNGSIQVRSYENREGQKIRVTEIVAKPFGVQFLERGDNRDNGQSNPPTNSTPNQRRYEDDPFAD